MLVSDCVIETGVVRSGMLVREVFAECGATRTQALPFVDKREVVIGRVTLKNIMKFSCLPEYMVDLAPLLGSYLSCVENAEQKVHQVLCRTVDPYVRNVHPSIRSDAPAIKALAMMEKKDTSYLFVVDEKQYRGIITIQGIAAKMSELETCMSNYEQ